MGTTCATTANALCVRSGELRGSLMPSEQERATTVAQLAADEATARRVMDVVSESFDPLAAVAGASEDGPDRWTVAIHFRDPPNETAVRALIALAAGADAANGVAFETTTPQDWVKASHEGLRPIEAGRFVVHTAHYRTRVPKNRIAIEIEASLAFGTGHHGTTRGCLLALDRIVKEAKKRRLPAVGPSGATTFPPPLWGRDRERGGDRAPRVRTIVGCFRWVSRTKRMQCAVVPLSLSLPHKG